MEIASLEFLALSAVAALLHNVWANRYWRDGTFLLVNLAFLASFSTNPVVFAPLAAFLAAGYVALQVCRRRPPTAVFVALVVATVAAFCWLKKYFFLAPVGFLPMLYATIGLSYIFFRVLHLLIDAYEGQLDTRIDPLSYVNFTINFTTLVAGPIQLYQDYARPRRRLTLITAGRAAERIVIGMFKVLVLSAALSVIQTQATAELAPDMDLATRIGTGLLSVGLYPIYLYFNFSGYVDIVIGVARFIGLELPENFDRPFSSLNFMELWSRWHITLSSWLKTYVYNPLMRGLMSRFPSPRLDLAIGSFVFFVTFFLMGVWHGRTAIFVIFGFLLGLGVSANKIYQTLMARRLGRKRYRALAAHPLYQACARGLTFTWFASATVCFWTSGTEALRIVQTLGMDGAAIGFVVLFAVSTVILAAHEAVRNWALSICWQEAPVILSRYLRTVWATTLAFVAVASVLLMETPAPDIVYKAF